MNDRELMQQVLDALFMFVEYDYQGNPLGGAHFNGHKAIEALRARLAQPEPEPWGYISHKSWKMPVFVKADDLQAANLPYNNPDYTPVYKAPPQREWQGLTDKDWIIGKRSADYIAGAEWAEAKLKEKNNG